MNKIKFVDFEKAVREARAFVNHYDKVRFKICTIALRVCDLSHGGRKKNSFSISNFAKAIDLNPKTLMEWLRIKRNVVDKLPVTELKDKSKYTYFDLATVASQVKPETSKRDVLRLWKDQLAQPQESKKFIKYELTVNSILTNSRKPIKLLNVDEELLKRIASKCFLVHKFLNVEFKLRQNLSTKERWTGKKDLEEKAVKEGKEVFNE